MKHFVKMKMTKGINIPVFYEFFDLFSIKHRENVFPNYVKKGVAEVVNRDPC